MLFKNLFNWIKYKTLPPSVLFRNRLFIERDVKHRRISTMLGLTFRNSKWSNYARPNLSTKLSESYARFMKTFLFILALVFTASSFSFFYTTLETLNWVTSVLWFITDFTSFSFAFTYFTILFWFQMCVTKVYSTYWLSQWSARPSNPTLNTHVVGDFLPKHLRKYALYSYLKSPTQDNVDLSNYFPPVFRFTNDYNMIQLVYQSSTVLSWLKPVITGLSQRSLAANSLSNSSMVINRVALCGNNSELLRQHASLVLNYGMVSRTQTNEISSQSTTSSLRNLHRWNLYGFLTEPEMRGNYYVPEANLSLLNKFTSDSKQSLVWTDSIYQTIKSVKSQYWLYKYNLLHRSVFKNSHTLTVVKRLIGTGFFDSKLTRSNLWASTELDVFTNYGGFQASNKALFDLLYNINNADSSKLSLQIASSPVTNSLQTLSFYQSSFNWFLARSYNFNGLQSSSLTSSYSLLQAPTLKATQSTSNKLKLALTPYLQSALLTNNVFIGQLASSDIKFNSIISANKDGSGQNYNLKDVYLAYSTQSAYNLTTLNTLLDLLQANALQPKLFQYPQLANLNTHLELELMKNGYELNTSLTPTRLAVTYTPLSSLENILLSDLIFYTSLINK